MRKFSCKVAVKQLVHKTQFIGKPHFLLALLASFALTSSNLPAIGSAVAPSITSLSVVGTNLEFHASIPADATEAVLEMRFTLEADWADTARLEIPLNGGEIAFLVPKPELEMAFFRLRISNASTVAPVLSTELRYVTMPSLATDDPQALANTNAVFHFRGKVDGSDRILITRQGAFWEHVNWNWPAGNVTINGSQWNPQEKNYLTTTGAVLFLPAAYSLHDVQLETIAGRDVVALERTNEALLVYLNDTPSGVADYEFKIHFRPQTFPPARAPSPAATLRIAAAIDGSDTLKITTREATWQHRAYQFPSNVNLNRIPWDVRQTNTLANTEPNAFLPTNVDLSTARITQRNGRDVATMWAAPEALWIQFADNPNGTDTYELEIAFGQ